MSWWLNLNREHFAQAIAHVYAVNVADPPSRGAYMRLRAEQSSKEQASRGGKAAKREFKNGVAYRGRRRVA